jgi:hypothetical protein
MLDHAFRETERVGAEPVSDDLKTFSAVIEKSIHSDKIHSITPICADSPRYFD